MWRVAKIIITSDSILSQIDSRQELNPRFLLNLFLILSLSLSLFLFCSCTLDSFSSTSIYYFWSITREDPIFNSSLPTSFYQKGERESWKQSFSLFPVWLHLCSSFWISVGFSLPFGNMGSASPLSSTDSQKEEEEMIVWHKFHWCIMSIMIMMMRISTVHEKEMNIMMQHVPHSHKTTPNDFRSWSW